MASVSEVAAATHGHVKPSILEHRVKQNLREPHHLPFREALFLDAEERVEPAN
jgi:hypothetical protein